MSVIFDSCVHSVGEMKNLAFYMKATRDAIQAMYNLAGLPTTLFDQYDFQDDATLVGAINKGTGGVLGNMAWTNAALRTGNGWYAHPCPGANGFGMVGVGGVSAEYGSVISHAGNNLNGATKATFLFKVRMNGTGGAGAGRIAEAGGSYIIFASAANTLAVSIYDGAAWHSNTTGANVVYGHWHDLAIVFDGTLVGDLNRCKIYLDGIDVTTVAVAGMPAAMVDPAAIRYILNCEVTFNRAWDGDLGFYGAYPALAMSQAQIQSLVEIRGLFQPTVANQPLIHTPGHFGGSEYDFDGVAPANNDYLSTYQVSPIKTSQGSLLFWFSPDDFTAEQVLLSMAVDGALDDEFFFDFRADVANDPLFLYYYINAVNTWRGDLPTSLFNTNINFLALTSDGSTTRAYYNGEEVVITNSIGANSGQWFGGLTDANIFQIAALRNVLQYNGKVAKLVIRDDCLSPIEIAKLAQSSALGWNRSYGT